MHAFHEHTFEIQLPAQQSDPTVHENPIEWQHDDKTHSPSQHWSG